MAPQDDTLAESIAYELRREILRGSLPPGAPIKERVMAAAGALAALHARALPHELPVAGEVHRIPPYDMDALLIEVELATEWYAPHVAGMGVSSSAATLTCMSRMSLPSSRTVSTASTPWVRLSASA